MKQSDQLAKVNSQFALVTNPHGSQYRGESDPVPLELPVVMLGLDNQPTSCAPALVCGSLLGGSSAAPLAVFATVIGSMSIILLANPLDSVLRAAMTAHRDAGKLPLMMVSRDGLSSFTAPPVRAWAVALQDTQARLPVSSVEWLDAAKAYVPLVPAILGQRHPEFHACQEHHVYTLVPEERGHPLFEYLQRGALKPAH
jgi:hypothetical protein